MANVEDVDGADDPRTARIMRRMRIFVGISTATMAVGFLLVMSVIVWRLVKADGSRAPAGGDLHSVLPIGKGQRITGTTSDGDRLFVTVEGEDGHQAIHVYDAGSLAYRGRIEGLTP